MFVPVKVSVPAPVLAMPPEEESTPFKVKVFAPVVTSIVELVPVYNVKFLSVVVVAPV